MKRLKPPVCTSCKGLAVFQSEVWPSIYICQPCRVKVTSYLWKKMPEVLEGNPFVREFCDTDGHGTVGFDVETDPWSFRRINFIESKNNS